MGITFTIIFGIIAVAALTLAIVENVKTIKNTIIKVDFARFLKKMSVFGAIFSLALVGFCCFIFPLNHWNANTGEYFATIFGSLFSGVFGFISLNSFILHYYGKNIPSVLDKWLFRGLVISFPLMFVFIFVLSNGYADFMNLNHPLANGINFKYGFAFPDGDYSPNIAFYALCILSGALYCYFYCDHKFYKQYGKHGILESTFLVAFPAGIIGARLFYVIGVFEEEFKGATFMEMIDLTQGGLTILGGAITGIVVGVAWFLWRNKKYSIWFAVDTIVPAILIAQAVGRWGNFFNCEVHGLEVSESLYSWLPKFIFNNAHYSDVYGFANEGMLWAPLFLIESLTNFLGFFVLAHLFGNKWKKYLKPGDLTFGYLLWYGMTRLLMEPLRAKAYQMNTWSWIWSFAFLFAGMLLIGGNHLIRYLIDKKKQHYILVENSFKRGLIGTIATSIISIISLIVGIILVANNKFNAEVLALNPFNIGLIFVACGVSILFLLMIYIPYLKEGWDEKNATK